MDEPTNHLDMETAGWLEQYMKHYKNAVVMVSHDRFFLDQTADVVYELTGKGLRRYPGNYTHYREEKLKQIRLQKKAYERQQEELARLENLVERFKHKPNKAAFARAKRKTMEHMERVEKPQEDDAHIFYGPIPCTDREGGQKYPWRIFVRGKGRSEEGQFSVRRRKGKAGAG